MLDVLINHEFTGNPIPFKRPRFTRNNIGYNDPDYDRYKKNLAASLLVAYPDVLGDVPPVKTRERSKWLKANRYGLSVHVYRADNRHADLDNFIKTVCDALQDANVIVNDSQIDVLGGCFKTVDPANPRVEIVLWKLDPETNWAVFKRNASVLVNKLLKPFEAVEVGGQIGG